MLNQEPQTNQEVKLRTRRGHCQSSRHRSHRSDLAFDGSYAIAGATCSLLRPTPSRSGSCFGPTRAPRPILGRPWKIRRKGKGFYGFKWEGDSKFFSNYLLTHFIDAGGAFAGPSSLSAGLIIDCIDGRGS